MKRKQDFALEGKKDTIAEKIIEWSHSNPLYKSANKS